MVSGHLNLLGRLQCCLAVLQALELLLPPPTMMHEDHLQTVVVHLRSCLPNDCNDSLASYLPAVLNTPDARPAL